MAVCREEGHANEVVVVDFAPQTVPSAAAAKGALETTSDSVPEQLQQRLE